MQDSMKKLLKANKEYQFAIKKERLGDGRVKLTPVVKLPGLFSSWVTITKDFNRYRPIDIGTEHEFTAEECKEYISGFKDQLMRDSANKILEISYELA